MLSRLAVRIHRQIRPRVEPEVPPAPVDTTIRWSTPEEMNDTSSRAPVDMRHFIPPPIGKPTRGERIMARRGIR